VNAGNVEKLLIGVDCVVDGLDNMRTRYLVNRACARLKVPYVFGAAIGVEGNLSVFAPPETPCLECVLPNLDDSTLLTCDVRGVLGATPGIIGTMQAMETIKLLAGIGTPLKGKLMICDFNDMYFTTIEIQKRKLPSMPRRNNSPKNPRKTCLAMRPKHSQHKPRKTNKTKPRQIYTKIKENFKIRIKSSMAIVFTYKNYEITLFNGGRMLIKNVQTKKQPKNLQEKSSKN
jgi:hypothetical protein